MSLISTAQRVVAQDTELKRSIATAATDALALTTKVSELTTQLAQALDSDRADKAAIAAAKTLSAAAIAALTIAQAQEVKATTDLSQAIAAAALKAAQNESIATGTIGKSIAAALANIKKLTDAETAFIAENDTAYYQIDLMPFRKIPTPPIVPASINQPIVDLLKLSPVFVFSIDKLTSEPGAVFQVDRDSDRAILELDRVGNDLDLATLQTFIGASGASISKIYDKSGKNNHAIQADKGKQPRIAEAGVINTVNGKPTLRFNNSNLATPAPMLTLSELDIFLVHESISRTQSIVFDLTGSDTNRGLAHLPWTDGTAYFDIGDISVHTTDRISAPDAVAVGTLALIELNHSVYADIKNIVINGTAIASGQSSIDPPTCTQFDIGAGSQAGFDGNLSELILFDKYLSADDRLALSNDRAAYYAIAGYITPAKFVSSGTLLTDSTNYTGAILDLSAYATGNINFTNGPASIPGGITFISTNPNGSILGQNSGGNLYHLGTNGYVDGIPVFAGLSSNTDSMDFSFATPVSQFGAAINYDPDLGVHPVITSYDAAGNVLSSFDLTTTPLAAISTPNGVSQFMFRGISEPQATISRVRFSNALIVVVGSGPTPPVALVNSGALLTSATGYTGLTLDLTAYATGTNNYTQGPQPIPGGITFTSSNPYGSTLGQNSPGNTYDINQNGAIDSVPVFAGLESRNDYMEFSFATPVSQFGAPMNYEPNAPLHPVITSYDAAGNVLSSFDLVTTPGGAISTPNGLNQFLFRGISEPQATISRVRFSYAVIAVKGN